MQRQHSHLEEALQGLPCHDHDGQNYLQDDADIQSHIWNPKRENRLLGRGGSQCRSNLTKDQ